MTQLHIKNTNFPLFIGSFCKRSSLRSQTFELENVTFSISQTCWDTLYFLLRNLKIGVFYLQNFLNNFHVSNPLIVTARILLLFQLLTVFPLIMFILRSQIFMLISKNDNVGYCQIYMLNAALITICVLFAIFMPSIGNIIRYTGALCGAIVVFVLPSFVYMASAKKAGQLRPSTICIHLSIILIGMVNFAAQFFI